MNMLMREFEPTTVGELKGILGQFDDDMPVTDSLGELLCVRVYKDEDTGGLFMEMQ